MIGLRMLCVNRPVTLLVVAGVASSVRSNDKTIAVGWSNPKIDHGLKRVSH